MQKVLIIGKNGQLSKALTKYAGDFGFEALVFGSVELDMRDAVSAGKKITDCKPDIVINTAAYNLVGRAEEYPDEATALNFTGVSNLAEICKKLNIKFMTFSTDYVFDGESGLPNDEKTIPHPLQKYGLSKFAGEQAVLNIYPEGSFVIRTSGLYGGGLVGSPSKGNFVLTVLKEAKIKDEIEISSSEISNPTFADDLAEAVFKLLKADAAPGIYHLASEGYCSWAEFAAEIFKLSGVNKKVIPADRGGVRGNMRVPKFSALLNTKAKALGVELPPWQDGLRRYIMAIK